MPILSNSGDIENANSGFNDTKDIKKSTRRHKDGKRHKSKSKYKDQIKEKDILIKELNESLLKAKDDINSFNNIKSEFNAKM